MYIFIKIHDDEDCKRGNKPFIITHNDLGQALNIVCEKYYGMKFTKIMNVLHYPKFLDVLECIRSL